jgi:hypothetical protein
MDDVQQLRRFQSRPRRLVLWHERDTLAARGRVAAWIDKREPAGRHERLFRLLLAPGNAAVIDRFDAIAGTCATTLSLGRGNA